MCQNRPEMTPNFEKKESKIGSNVSKWTPNVHQKISIELEFLNVSF